MNGDAFAQMAGDIRAGGIPARGARGAHVFGALLDLIRSGQLPPGRRIREDEVAEMLGVSRTPVREALAKLQARGLIEAAAQGMAVAELSRTRILELYAMRSVLEAAAARFAAENATPSDLDILRHTARRFENAGEAADDVARANSAFHQAIYEAAHNSYLMRMLEDLNDSLALLPNTTFALAGRAVRARAEHLLVLEAIVARDPDAAEAAARAHMAEARDARLALLFAGS